MVSFLKKIVITLCTILIFSCQADDKNTVKIGAISGPESDLLQSAKKYAKEKYNLNIKIIEFSDYLQPNAALDDGSIDANMFQHKPYLDQQNKDKNYNLVSIGKTFVYPMGVYSNKYKDLNNLPNGAKVGIPNDTSNEGRALLLLEKAKLIKLNKKAGLYATPHNIIENPKKLKFIELDASQLARSLPDLAIATINTNYAVAAKLNPKEQSIFSENKDSPYANIIVAREDRKNDLKIKQLVKSIQSDAVLKTANILFNNQAIKAW
ncbi:MetQ/NlpA family ABC transporter substrate-binding protein [Gammaproteobacteria bacterium]|nr:MetQ/NlpA family ABC transporter substrate-binding protein [Gammaproteobacteria bacterium]